MLCLPVNAAAQDAGVAELLARLDEKRPDLEGRCLTAAFDRRKTTPLLRRPLASSGTLTASGDALRWETVEPRPGTTVIAGGEMRIVYPEEKRVEVFALPPSAAAGFGPAAPLSALAENFEVTLADPPAWDGEESELPGLIGLRLVPRDADAAAQVRSIGLGIEEASGAVRLLETVDGDDSATTYRFGEPEILDRPCDIEPPAPEGYEVVRPYGG